MAGNNVIDVKKLMKLDLYGILHISIDASESEIRKAYKKRALKCHPDKNPDNPDAAAEFVKLTQALEVLLDVSARAAYDAYVRAKQASVERHRQLDSQRKRMKEDLEARETAAKVKEEASNKPVYEQHKNHLKKDAAKLLEQEIERLRKESSRLVEEEKEKLREQLKEEALKSFSDVDDGVRVRVKWNCSKTDNGGYSETILHDIFDKYGEVETLLLSKKKGGSAIVEFRSQENAAAAVLHEKGHSDNPLLVSWLTPPSSGTCDSSAQQNQIKAVPVSSCSFTPVSRAADSGFSDFESLVMMKLRQAEERKRLAEQMADEDKEQEKK